LHFNFEFLVCEFVILYKQRKETIMKMSFPKPQVRPISLDAKTTLGYVHLTVPDLKQSLAFYQNVLGFRVHRTDKNVAHLGAGADDLLLLTENPDAKLPARRATGLYHFAILVPSRFELARALRSFIEHDIELGFGDHIVSEAIYFNDPDGNGIEVYRDRPRSEWYDKNGDFVMGTLPVDVRGVMSELENETEPWQGLHRDTVLGHMHLKISNVNRDETFYRDILGFDEMANMGSAAFLSAGGYHHHLGMNVWESAGSAPPPLEAAGLKYFTVNLPNADEMSRVTNRLLQAGAQLEETDAGLLVRDPSKNTVVLTTRN
jgi:catechol 2,3-dioxygenase